MHLTKVSILLSQLKLGMDLVTKSKYPTVLAQTRHGSDQSKYPTVSAQTRHGSDQSKYPTVSAQTRHGSGQSKLLYQLKLSLDLTDKYPTLSQTGHGSDHLTVLAQI